ncbi:MAG: DUF475 domain-containing protein [Campylobacteraceae bacterium]
MKHFGFSFLFTAVCLAVAAWWGYSHGGWGVVPATLFVVAVLGIMEVSLSFDNAVVNASVLKNWDEFWKKIFLTVGIFVAVFAMRLFFPLAIVSHTADLGIIEVWNLALQNPNEYSKQLTTYHAEISTFGGMFLLLVFLNFMFDSEKSTHWIGFVEKRLANFGNINSAAVFVALLILMAVIQVVPAERQLSVLLFGLQGVLIYLGVKGISSLLEAKQEGSGELVKKGSIGGFLYLEVLDASFSFDGVIGAFAITKDIVLIMLGLGIGAIFVRSITIYLVDKGTLDEFVYLESGAHWAIGALAVIMLLSIKFHIHEVVTGLVGVVFIASSIVASIIYKKRKKVT